MPTISAVWTRPIIETMLHEFRKRKCLYDQTNHDYLNRPKRQKCLEDICRMLLDKFNLSVSVEELKNKIQVLRSQFNKDLRSMDQNKKYKPKFWCFKKMEWLKPYVSHRYSHNASIKHSRSKALETNPEDMDSDSARSLVAASAPVPDYANIYESEHKFETPQITNGPGIEHQCENDMTSSTTLEADESVMSSNIQTSRMVETVFEDPEPEAEPSNDHFLEDINDQFYETIALTQQIVQNRMAAKERRAENGISKSQTSWEADLVTSQLELISDETIRSDTMWEIQCVLRRGIEQDRVLPQRRRAANRRLSMPDADERSPNGSCISLDSSDSLQGMN